MSPRRALPAAVGAVKLPARTRLALRSPRWGDGRPPEGHGTLPQNGTWPVADGEATTAEAAVRSALRAVGRPGLAAFLGLWSAPLRRWGYRTVAANRTRWFGRTEAACPLPEDSQRFLL